MNELPGDGDYGTRIDPHTIRFERDLFGPIERVWSYLTESDKRATWLYPGDIPSTPGGESRKSWPGKDGEPQFTIVIRTRIYDPPRTLEYEVSEAAAGAPARDSRVRFELREDGERVHLTLTHAALAPEAFASVGAGWHAHLAVLVAVLTETAGDDAETRYERLLPRYEAMAAP